MLAEHIPATCAISLESALLVVAAASRAMEVASNANSEGCLRARDWQVFLVQ